MTNNEYVVCVNELSPLTNCYIHICSATFINYNDAVDYALKKYEKYRNYNNVDIEFFDVNNIESKAYRIKFDEKMYLAFKEDSVL